MKKVLVILLAGIIFMCTLAACVSPAGQGPGELPRQEQSQVSEPENPVYLSITGPEGRAAILEREAFEIVEGETVFDLLLRVTRAKSIHMEFSGKGSTAYVKGIDNLYEFDEGGTSGWTVYVNGEFLNKSPGKWELDKGDIIEWKYTKD